MIVQPSNQPQTFELFLHEVRMPNLAGDAHPHTEDAYSVIPGKSSLHAAAHPVRAYLGSVSYTHLTLPTIYPV